MDIKSRAMIPTLLGRWQTRIFLLATIGVLVSLPFAFGFIDLSRTFNPVFFWVLLYVGIFGLGWDILYNYLQKYLWDHDWPGVLQFFGAIAEGILLILLIKFVGLPHIPQALNLYAFVVHYSVVSVFAYLASWVVMRILFPRWRFRGGQWIGKWPRR